MADVRTVHNKILASIPVRERSQILKHAELVRLPTDTVLAESHELLTRAYFIETGLASVLNVMLDGKSVEVGLCGAEGFVGAPLLADFKTAPNRVVMQVGGSGFAISSRALIETVRTCPSLAKQLQRFGQMLNFQSTQVAACNRLHDVEQRLARWLLMSQDRLGGRLVPLTQEYLSHMLATRRASVTVAARGLQNRKLIAYSRGRLTIRDRRGLEDASCECYQAIVTQNGRWESEVR